MDSRHKGNLKRKRVSENEKPEKALMTQQALVVNDAKEIPDDEESHLSFSNIEFQENLLRIKQTAVDLDLLDSKLIPINLNEISIEMQRQAVRASKWQRELDSHGNDITAQTLSDLLRALKSKDPSHNMKKVVDTQPNIINWYHTAELSSQNRVDIFLHLAKLQLIELIKGLWMKNKLLWQQIRQSPDIAMSQIIQTVLAVAAFREDDKFYTEDFLEKFNDSAITLALNELTAKKAKTHIPNPRLNARIRMITNYLQQKDLSNAIENSAFSDSSYFRDLFNSRPKLAINCALYFHEQFPNERLNKSCFSHFIGFLCLGNYSLLNNFCSENDMLSNIAWKIHDSRLAYEISVIVLTLMFRDRERYQNGNHDDLYIELLQLINFGTRKEIKKLLEESFPEDNKYVVEYGKFFAIPCMGELFGYTKSCPKPTLFQPARSEKQQYSPDNEQGDRLLYTVKR